jgi:hypothetical protein
LTFEKIKAGKKLLLSFDYKCNDTTWPVNIYWHSI